MATSKYWVFYLKSSLKQCSGSQKTTGHWRKTTGRTEKRQGAAPCRFGLARTLMYSSVVQKILRGLHVFKNWFNKVQMLNYIKQGTHFKLSFDLGGGVVHLAVGSFTSNYED